MSWRDWFNRREEQALSLLSAALLAGGAVSLYEGYRPQVMEEFRLLPAAVALPAPSVVPAVIGGPTRINAASAIELEVLPGIGPQMARRIVEARLAGGRFQRLEDLARVKGIGPRTLEKLRPLVVID
jgi:competence protein ComEA